MSAHEANWMLRKKPSGTFLIRFSKSQAGCFAVTFVDSKCQVKHSLLYSLTDQWGLTLKNPPKGKNFTTLLPDVIFRSVLRDSLLSNFKCPKTDCNNLQCSRVEFTFSGNLNFFVTHRAIIDFPCNDVRSAFHILLNVAMIGHTNTDA